MSMQIQNPNVGLPMGIMGAMEDVNDTNTSRGTNATNASTAINRASNNVGMSAVVPQVNLSLLSERVELNRGAVTNYSAESLSQAHAACASFFGSVLALIQQTTSELHRDNRELSYQAQMQAADSLDKQAETMRDKAVINLVTGIVQGGLQIAGGMAQMASSIKAAADVYKAVPPAEGVSRSQALLQALSDPVQGSALSSYMQHINNYGSSIGQMMQGAGATANALGSFFATQKDADLQAEQANQKRLEAFAEQLKSINESFNQTVQAAIETSKSISQSMVETNKRILV